jgi:hypothetical protein
MQIDVPDYPITCRQRLRLAGALVFAGLVALLSACNLQPEPPRTPWTEARELKPATATLGTQPLTLLEASHSVFMIDVSGVTKNDKGEPVLGNWTATVWVVATAPDHTLLATAGHVCEPKSIYTFDNAQGHTYYAPKVLIDDDNVDVCILTYPKPLGPAIALADAEPAYGEHGAMIGAPQSIWGGGFAGVYDAVYAGRGNPAKGHCDDPDDPGLATLCANVNEFVTCPGCQEGSSGGPVLFDGRAIGLVSLSTPSLASSVVPWDVVRSLVDRAARM